MNAPNLADLGEAACYGRVLDLYKEHRARLVAEQGYYFQRLSAFVSSQSFLLAAYGLSVFRDRSQNPLDHLPVLVSLIGVAIGVVLIRGMRGSLDAIEFLAKSFREAAPGGVGGDVEKWSRAYGFPPIVLDQSIRVKGHAVGLYPWLLLAFWALLMLLAAGRA